MRCAERPCATVNAYRSTDATAFGVASVRSGLGTLADGSRGAVGKWESSGEEVRPRPGTCPGSRAASPACPARSTRMTLARLRAHPHLSSAHIKTISIGARWEYSDIICQGDPGRSAAPRRARVQYYPTRMSRQK